MKLTKRQLRRIIREEYSRMVKNGLLREMRGPEDLPYGDVTGQKSSYNKGPDGRATEGSLRQYINEHYLDFIDMYIRFESSPEYFLDRWEEHCDDTGIPCTQDHLVALKNYGVQEGDFEEDSPGLFIGTRGGY